MKLATVIGARPQFIKAAAVSRAIGRRNAKGPGRIEEILVHTGQHYDADMSEVFFRELSIPEPAVNLGIHEASHGAMTGRMLEKLESVFLDFSPDAVLIYGDTNSTLAGALAAAKLHIPVAHVEAGLRSFDQRMPEEINRVMADHVSSILFCPTEQAVKNLAQEGIRDGSTLGGGRERRIFRTGDVMMDAALFYAEEGGRKDGIFGQGSPLKGLSQSPYVLATVHRAENTDDAGRLEGVVQGLMEIARSAPVVLPLHPRTRRCLDAAGIRIPGSGSRIFVIPPVGYLDMLGLLKNAVAVVTDSGGLQKEAFFFKKPCITLRERTEWSELTEAGVNRLAGGSPSEIRAAFSEMSVASLDFSRDFYGRGDAAEKIVEILARSFD